MTLHHEYMQVLCTDTTYYFYHSQIIKSLKEVLFLNAFSTVNYELPLY